MTLRTLVLLRHAKADNAPGVLDFDRPLTPRGHADATGAGAWLTARGYPPDLVLCSPSRRTRETWHGVALNLTASPQVDYEQDIYGGDTDDLLALVRAVPDEVHVTLLIGHNPTISQLSLALDPDSADPDGLRTCGIAVHAFDGAWADCGAAVTAALAASHTARAQA